MTLQGGGDKIQTVIVSGAGLLMRRGNEFIEMWGMGETRPQFVHMQEERPYFLKWAKYFPCFFAYYVQK